MLIDSAPTWIATVVFSNESYIAAKGELATNIAITAAANKRMPPADSSFMKSRTAVSTPDGVELLVFTMEPDSAEFTILTR